MVCNNIIIYETIYYNKPVFLEKLYNYMQQPLVVVLKRLMEGSSENNLKYSSKYISEMIIYG